MKGSRQQQHDSGEDPSLPHLQQRPNGGRGCKVRSQPWGGDFGLGWSISVLFGGFGGGWSVVAEFRNELDSARFSTDGAGGMMMVLWEEAFSAGGASMRGTLVDKRGKRSWGSWWLFYWWAQRWVEFWVVGCEGGESAVKLG